MKKDWLENNINEKLQDYESEIDLDQAWSVLSAKRNHRRRAAWWIIPGILLLVAIGLIWYTQSIDPSKEMKTQKFIQALSPASADENAISSTSDAKQNTREEPSQASINNATDRIESNAYSSKLKIQQDQQQTGQRSSESNFTLTHPEAFEKKPQLPVRKSKPVASVKNQVLSSEVPKDRNLLEALPPMTGKQFIVNGPVPSLPNLNLQKAKQAVSTSHSSWSVGLQGGFGLLTRTFTSSSGDTLSANRQELEDPVDYWSAGLVLRKKAGEHWLLKTGINYTEIYTRIQQSVRYEYTEMQSDQIIAIYQYADGTEEIIRGEAEVQITDETKYDLWQIYRSISIPVSVAYTISGENALQFRPAVGIAYTLFHEVAGNTLHLQDDTAPDLPPLESLYRSGSLFHLQASFELEYKLPNRFSIALSAGGQFDLSNRAEEQQAFEDRFQRVGIQAGLFYHW